MAAFPAPAHHDPGCNTTTTCDRRVEHQLVERERRARAAKRRRMATATASWYDDAGGTACGFHAALGVAHRTLPCGTRVELCASRCATATVDDRGPFIAGRTWDLDAQTRATIGASDLGPVRWRIPQRRG